MKTIDTVKGVLYIIGIFAAIILLGSIGMGSSVNSIVLSNGDLAYELITNRRTVATFKTKQEAEIALGHIRNN